MDAGSDRSTDLGQRGGVKCDPTLLVMDTQFLPELAEVRRFRVARHLFVEIVQHFRAGRRITRRDYAADLPLLRAITACIENRPDRILQRFLPVCLPADLDIRQQPEQATSPVRPAPSVRL